MFKVTTTHRFIRTVEVVVPSETKADAFEKQTFRAVFEVMDPDASDDAIASMALAKTAGEVLREEIAQILAVLVGWEDVDVEFSEDAVRAACRFPWFRKGVAEAYRAGVAGEEARLGN